MLNMNSADSKETPRSKTLAIMEMSPKTVCVDCQNAVWHSLNTKAPYEVQVYCRLMHEFMKNVNSCDGQTPHEAVSPDEPVSQTS